MNALDFLVEFIHFEGTSDHLLPQHNQKINASKHPICSTGAEMMTSARPMAYERNHFTQEASEQEATSAIPTDPLSTQHMFSVSATHLADPNVTSFEHHDIPYPSIEHDDHTSQTFTRYPQKQHMSGPSYETISGTPQTYYQQSNHHAPWTTGYEASNAQASALNTRYDSQTPYTSQPLGQQETSHTSFSSGASSVQIHCSNIICGCWLQPPQSHHSTESKWPPWNATQAAYCPEVAPMYNDWTLESKRPNFSTI